MKTLIVLLVFAIGVIAYVGWLRPWLRAQPFAQGFFAWIEPIEIMLWSKSETMLWARFLQLVGLLVPALHFIAGVDITPVIGLIPEDYQSLLFLLMWLAGILSAKLRKDTTKPLEVVALPQDVPPEVALAVKHAEDASRTAVAVVEAEQGV